MPGYVIYSDNKILQNNENKQATTIIIRMILTNIIVSKGSVALFDFTNYKNRKNICKCILYSEPT